MAPFARSLTLPAADPEMLSRRRPAGRFRVASPESVQAADPSYQRQLHHAADRRARSIAKPHCSCGGLLRYSD
jgi:hypothetical protein